MRTYTGTSSRLLVAATILALALPGVARAQNPSPVATAPPDSAALRLSLPATVSFLPADASSSQSSGSGGGVGVGIKGGFLYNSLSFSDASQVYDGRAGWTIGLFFGGSSGVIGLMGEINFQKKGASDATTGAITDLYYLDLPALLRINFGSRSPNGVGVYAILGPGFDFKIGDSISSLAIYQNYETFNINFIGGLGVEITRFIIEGRGIWGLRNIAVTQLTSQQLKSRSFALQVGVRFN